MPRSIVVYTSPEGLSDIRTAAQVRFGAVSFKPYTFSFGQKSDSQMVRVRVTELVDGVMAPWIGELLKHDLTLVPGTGDRDVKTVTYDELLSDADRFMRESFIQFASPTILEVAGSFTPFPVLSSILHQYFRTWNTFSRTRIETDMDELLGHIQIKDFKISSAESRYGAGGQGWIALEIEKGRTEEEIRILNCLIDYAFFCGTGMHTEEGFGQTRRLPSREKR